MSFDSFDLHPTLKRNIERLGFTTPTPIQEQGMPAVMAGDDVLGIAQTGTGKTAAFGLPVLHRLINGPHGKLRALILAPTRELAEQIHEAFGELGRDSNLAGITIYGGVGINPQIKELRRGVEIAVACPGRLIDHMQRGTIDLRHVDTLILDEADQMCDMGFLPSIRKIIKALPRQRQTLMFSATMPREIRKLADEILDNPTTVEIGHQAPAETVAHAVYKCHHKDKSGLLKALLDETDTGSVLVFTRTKHRAKRTGDALRKAGYSATTLQGNLSQSKRRKAMNGFREGRYQIMVATDIASRGIDVAEISHVINFDMPDTVEAYTHRIGRTGRAAESGDAFTFVTADDHKMLRAIERKLDGEIEERTHPDFDAPRQGRGHKAGTRGAKNHRHSRGRNKRRRGRSRG